jgi:large subunit ribosomal protein L3
VAMLLGKKVGMTQVYDEKERLLPVTVIQAGPCVVMQVKTVETDGYNAVQLGFDDVKASRCTKAAIARAEKVKTAPKRFIREMRLIGDAKVEVNPGDAVTVTTFAETKFVDVIGTSKGKGFAGPMKRWHFGGMPGSHGTERKHRSPGSQAGYGTDRGHGGDIKKGKKMGGHLGAKRITVKTHQLVSIDPENNLLVIKGSVPGPSGGYVIVRTSQKKKP